MHENLHAGCNTCAGQTPTFHTIILTAWHGNKWKWPPLPHGHLLEGREAHFREVLGQCHLQEATTMPDLHQARYSLIVLVIINYVNQWIRRQINEESCSAPWPEVTTFPCLKFPSTGNRHQQLQKPTLQPYLKNSHTSIKFNNKKELLKPLIVRKDWQSVVSLVRDEILERPPWRPNQAWCCWPSSWAGGTAHH